MELEFDKEIDAILRKEQGGIGVSAKDKPNHLDADSIAAFVENALPQKAKLMYVQHFADCDRCRKQLSFAISMNAEADQASALIVSDAVGEPAIPWYQRFFRSQNLAIAMGALVLSFGGLIGYLALQNSDGSRSSDVAMEKSPAASAPYSTGSATNTSTANSANIAVPSANAASGAANVIANSNSMASNPVLNQPANFPGRLDSKKESERSDRENVPVDSATADTSSPMESSPPPPPVTAPSAGATVSRSETSISKDEESVTAERKATDDRVPAQDGSPKPAAKRSAGPAKTAVNTQQQEYNTQNSALLGGGTTQRVSGRTFDNRNGVWYDLAYNGQSTKSYRRGTSEYKKLDGGLRSIADSINGTVVVIWKNKAYRIQ